MASGSGPIERVSTSTAEASRRRGSAGSGSTCGNHMTTGRSASTNGATIEARWEAACPPIAQVDLLEEHRVALVLTGRLRPP